MTNIKSENVVQFSGVKTAVILALEESNTVARVRARVIFKGLQIVAGVSLAIAMLALVPLAMIALQSVTGEYCINYPEHITCK